MGVGCRSRWKWRGIRRHAERASVSQHRAAACQRGASTTGKRRKHAGAYTGNCALAGLPRFALAIFRNRIVVGHRFFIRRRAFVRYRIIPGNRLRRDLMGIEYRHHLLRLAHALIVRCVQRTSLTHIMRDRVASQLRQDHFARPYIGFQLSEKYRWGRRDCFHRSAEPMSDFASNR